MQASELMNYLWGALSSFLAIATALVVLLRWSNDRRKSVFLLGAVVLSALFFTGYLNLAANDSTKYPVIVWRLAQIPGNQWFSVPFLGCMLAFSLLKENAAPSGEPPPIYSAGKRCPPLLMIIGMIDMLLIIIGIIMTIIFVTDKESLREASYVSDLPQYYLKTAAVGMLGSLVYLLFLWVALDFGQYWARWFLAGAKVFALVQTFFELIAQERVGSRFSFHPAVPELFRAGSIGWFIGAIWSVVVISVLLSGMTSRWLLTRRSSADRPRNA